MSDKTSRGKSESNEDRPKIYVTSKGARYVKADELLRSKRARAQIDAMAKLGLGKTSTALPSEESA